MKKTVRLSLCILSLLVSSISLASKPGKTKLRTASVALEQQKNTKKQKIQQNTQEQPAMPVSAASSSAQTESAQQPAAAIASSSTQTEEAQRLANAIRTLSESAQAPVICSNGAPTTKNNFLKYRYLSIQPRLDMHKKYIQGATDATMLACYPSSLLKIHHILESQRNLIKAEHVIFKHNKQICLANLEQETRAIEANFRATRSTTSLTAAASSNQQPSYFDWANGQPVTQQEFEDLRYIPHQENIAQPQASHNKADAPKMLQDLEHNKQITNLLMQAQEKNIKEEYGCVLDNEQLTLAEIPKLLELVKTKLSALQNRRLTRTQSASSSSSSSSATAAPKTK